MKLFSTNSHAPILRVGVVLFSVLVLTGCREGIVSYEIPKEEREAEKPSSAAGAAQRPPMPGIEFAKVPDGWTKVQGGEMRVATYSVEGKAEMAALPLPAMAGMTDVMLVNMWREQVGLKPANDEELAQMTKPIKVGEVDAKLFDVAAGERRIMVAMAQVDGWKWFFKFNGDAATIGDNKTNFETMLAGATFKAAPEMPAAPAAGPAPGRPAWTTPDHWQEQRAGMMQLAKYNAQGDGGATEITVVRMGGAAGGIPPNVNRWLGQVGLSSVSDSEANAMAKPIELPAGEGKIVEIVGESKSMIVLLVSQGGATWFYKSMGEKAAVEREKTALVDFVKSVQYN